MDIKKELQKYVDAGFNEAQLYEIEQGLKEGLDVSYYAKLEYDEFTMLEKRLWLADVKRAVDYLCYKACNSR